VATVRKIAQQAGVSITTVSRVLNNHPRVSRAARDRVLEAMNRTGYVATVGRRSTSNLAFFYTDEMSLGSPFDSSLLQGMSQRMDAAGFDLLVLSAQRSRRPHETYSQLFMRKGVQGAVIRTTTHTRHICEEIAAEGFAAVVVAEQFAPPVQHVYAEASDACRRAIEHLIHLGHRRIAITLNIIDDFDHMRRLAVYQQMLAEAGLPVEDRLVLRVPAYRGAGGVALRQIMAMPDRPTAVFVTDPMAAVGLFQEAHRQGVRIPEALSVIGFDDAESRYGTYPLMSAVCQDTEALGRAAIEKLLCLIEKHPDRAVDAPDCWLDLNESTAPPPQG
jgi:DNA-binding LacI/PurR family transcriptional regulator